MIRWYAPEQLVRVEWRQHLYKDPWGLWVPGYGILESVWVTVSPDLGPVQTCSWDPKQSWRCLVYVDQDLETYIRFENRVDPWGGYWFRRESDDLIFYRRDKIRRALEVSA